MGEALFARVAAREMANPTDLLGKRLLGRYKLTRVLGEGGMGVVLEARELATDKLVAIKVLHTREAHVGSSFRRFQQEVRTAAMVGRPHVTEVYDVGMLATGEPFFVMEKVEGDTLRQRITRDRWLSLKDVVTIFIQLLMTLEAVHAKGIIHRDIKPENIILSTGSGGRTDIKLIDFGVAKLVSPTPGKPMDITSTGVVVGTVWYASPEQVNGARDLDGRVDLWATGVCMIEALTGRRPFEAIDPLRLMLDITRKPHPRVRATRTDVPTELDTILAKALRKTREDRYASARAFRHDLVDMWNAHRQTRSSQRHIEVHPETVPGYTDSEALTIDGTAVELPMRRVENAPPPPPEMLTRTQPGSTRTPPV